MSEAHSRDEVSNSITKRQSTSKRWQRAFFGLAVVTGVATTHNVLAHSDTLAKVAAFSAEAGAAGGAITEKMLAARRCSRLVGQYAASQGVDYATSRSEKVGNVLEVARCMPTLLAVTAGEPFSTTTSTQALPIEAVAIGLHILSNETKANERYQQRLAAIDQAAALMAY